MSFPKNIRCRVSTFTPCLSPWPCPISLLTTEPVLLLTVCPARVPFPPNWDPHARLSNDLPRFRAQFAFTFNPPNIQNFNDEGVGVCDSGEYCRFVHPGPRWPNARSYHNRDEFDHIPRSYIGGGGGARGAGRGRPVGGGGGGKGPIPRRCRVSLFSARLFPFSFNLPCLRPSPLLQSLGAF